MSGQFWAGISIRLPSRRVPVKQRARYRQARTHPHRSVSPERIARTVNRLTSAILGELRTELRAASTEEFHRSTPVLGRLLDGVAHELDTLVSLHRQLDRTGTGDVVVLDAAAYG